LDLWSSLRWRRHLAAQVRPDGDQIVVQTAETTLRLPLAAEPALRRLLAGETLTVAELGANEGSDAAVDAPLDAPLGDTDRLELAGLLLRHAVVVPA
jgi:hypothetical protein